MFRHSGGEFTTFSYFPCATFSYFPCFQFAKSLVEYFPLIADGLEDLNSGTFRRLDSDEYELPDGAKHGSFVTITEEEYAALTDAWG